MLPYPTCFSSRTLNDDSGILMVRFFYTFSICHCSFQFGCLCYAVRRHSFTYVVSFRFYLFSSLLFHFCSLRFFKWFIFGLLEYADNLIHLKTPRRTSKEMGHTMGISRRTTHRPYPHSLLSWEAIWDPLFILCLLNYI